VPERIIFNGEPGTRWVNETGQIRYQFVCRLQNTCGACLQYHMAIGPWWPIPIHRNCRCLQVPIPAGTTARHEFVNFREVLKELSPAQQRAAIGASNYRLLKAGKVKWTDIVGKYHVRSLEEVVAFKKLSIEEMKAAGVKPWIAEHAHAKVHTPAADLLRQRRKELTEQILKAGVSQEQLVSELACGIASQAEIVGGFAPQTTAEFLSGGDYEEILARLLATGWRPKARPRPKRKQEPETPPDQPPE
jgi:hypothetical protein